MVFRGTALCAALVAAVLAMASSGAVMPPVLPIGDYPAYDATTPAALALIEPVAHAPWLGAGSLVWVAAVAAAVTAGLVLTSAAAGASVVATLIVVAAFISRPEIRDGVVVGAAPLAAVALVWLATIAGANQRQSSRTLIWQTLALGLAATVWPPIVIVIPVAAVAIGRGAVSAAGVMAGAAGAALGVVLWAARASALGDEAVSVTDAAAALLASAPRGIDPYVWPVTASLALPALLAVTGGIIRARRLTWSRRVALGVALLVPVTAWALAPAWHAEIGRAVQWSMWPLVAAGLTWLAPLARGQWLPVTVGAVLIAGGVAHSLRSIDDDEPRAFAAAWSTALTPVVAASPVTFVAEDTRTDTALLAWGAHAGIERIRPVARRVDDALARGRTVVAAPSTRWGLELWGFRFRPVARITTPAPFTASAVDGRLRCVPVAGPWRELPGLEFTGRLGLHVPAGEGRMEAVIVGPPPLLPSVRRLDGRSAGTLAPVPMALTTLPPVLWPGDGRLPDPSLVAMRLTLPAEAAYAQSVALTLGQRAPLVAVRFVAPAHLATIGTVCAAPWPRDDAGGSVALAIDDPGFFTGGWHGAERNGTTPFRWSERRSITQVPSAAAGPVTIGWTLNPAARPEGDVVRVALTVNGWPAGTLPLTSGEKEYLWRVPEGVWVAGTNELVLDVSHAVRPSDAGGTDARELALAVSGLRIVRPE